MAFREKAGVLAQERGKYESTEERLGRSARYRIAVSRAVGIPPLSGSARGIRCLVFRGAERGGQDIRRRDGLVDKDLEFSARRERPRAGGDIREEDRPASRITYISPGCAFVCLSGSLLFRLGRIRLTGGVGRSCPCRPLAPGQSGISKAARSKDQERHRIVGMRKCSR